MAREIRYFLFLRDSPHGAVEIEVFRAAAAVHHRWVSALERSDQSAGLLHVGEDRPSAVDVEPHLLQGRLKITEACLWVLPPDLRVATSVGDAVATGDGIVVGLFLVELGWGRFVEGVGAVQGTAPAQAMSRIPSDRLGRQLVGLLDEALSTPIAELPLAVRTRNVLMRHLGTRVRNPAVRDLADLTEAEVLALRNFGVTSLEDLIRVLSELPRLQPAPTEEAGARGNSPDLPERGPQRDHLQIILANLTPEMRDVRLSSLPFSVRTMNALRTNLAAGNEACLADLAELSVPQVMRWRHFGRTSLGDLLSTLRRFTKTSTISLSESTSPSKQPTLRDSDSLDAEFSSLFSGIETALSSLRDRVRDVLKLRLGWDGPPWTLDAIGTHVGITRERVRQLEENQGHRLIQLSWLGSLSERLSQKLSERSSPLYFEDLEAEDPWFDGVTARPFFFESLIGIVAEDQLEVLEVGTRRIVCRKHFGSWPALVAHARSLLRAKIPSRPSKSECWLLVESCLSSLGLRELTSLTMEHLEPQLHFAQAGSPEPRLVTIGRGIQQHILAVLEESEVPLHFTEIARRSSSRRGAAVGEQRALSDLRRLGADLFGRGTYGLRKHLALTEEQIAEIREEIEYILSESPSERQWHAAELLSMLQDLISELPESVNQYTVGMILEGSQIAQSIGRLVWTRRTQEKLPPRRIDIADAAIRILERAGGPLSHLQLIDELRRSRGLSSYTFLYPSASMARVAPGVWGLLDRDFPGTTSERSKLLGELCDLLSERECGIHISEVEAVVRHRLPGLTPYMLFQLASTDPRLRVYSGDLLGLASWETPRRFTLTGAAEHLATELTTPVSGDELQKRLEVLVRRPISRATVASLLGPAGFVYDAEAALWVPPPDEGEQETLDLEDNVDDIDESPVA